MKHDQPYRRIWLVITLASGFLQGSAGPVHAQIRFQSVPPTSQPSPPPRTTPTPPTAATPAAAQPLRFPPRSH